MFLFGVLKLFDKNILVGLHFAEREKRNNDSYNNWTFVYSSWKDYLEVATHKHSLRLMLLMHHVLSSLILLGGLCPVNVTCSGHHHLQNRGSYTSYTSGHFMWNLWNEPLVSFKNFIWSFHECEILFIIWLFQMGFHCLQNDHFNEKTHCWYGKCQWCYIYAPKCYYTYGHTILWHDKSNVIWYIMFMGSNGKNNSNNI